MSVRSDARQAERLAGVGRRAASGGPPAAPTGRPAVISAAACDPRAQQVAQLGGGREREVERGEHEPLLRRRRDPGLVRAVERHGAGRARRPSASA